MKNAVKLVLIIVILIAVLSGVFFLLVNGRKIPENPADVRGNTPGNLYNEGLFCEDDGVVYFSNSYDSGALYVMNSDETEIKRLEKYATKWINAAGDYLYYYQAADGADAIAGFGGHMMGIFRSKKSGGSVICLDKTPSGTVALCGNTLLYERYTNSNNEGMSLHSMKIDKKDAMQVKKEIIDPSCILNGYMYYGSFDGDHTLHRYDVAAGNDVVMFEAFVYNPIVLDDADTVYYMNPDDDYCLYRASIQSGETVKITEDRVDCFNISDSQIYYQKNSQDDPALMCCNLDGSMPQEIVKGNYKDINITSRYVYYRAFGADGITYHFPLGGIPVPTEFDGAMAAASEE